MGLTHTEVRGARFPSDGHRQGRGRAGLPQSTLGNALLLGGSEGEDGQGTCEGAAAGAQCVL